MANRRTKHIAFDIFLWLCLASAFLVASYVILHEYQLSLNTDGAVGDILAKLAINEGHLIPKNWTYSNGDLWILGPRLFFVIAYPIWGLGYSLHAVGTWLAYLYLLLMVYGACRTVAPSRPRAAIISTALAAGCLSTLNFEFVVGQGTYSLYAAFALALFVMVSRPIAADAPWRSRALTWLLVGFAAGLVCISNATRGNITIIAPLVSGWIAAIIFFPRPRWRQRIADFSNPVVFSVIAGAVAGTLLYRYSLLPSVINSSGASSFELVSISDAMRRIAALPSAWFVYFRIGGAWESLSFALRIAQCFAWLISIVLLLAPISVVITPRRHTRTLVTLSWITLACYTVTFAALIASRNLFDGPASLRYGTFAIYASICITAVLIEGMAEWRPRVSAILAALLCVASIWTISAWREEWTPGGITYRQRMALIASLEEHGVDTALATYWNSEVLTVLSDGKITVLPVDVSDAAGIQRHVQLSPRIALGGPEQGKQAIAFTADDASDAVWKTLADEFGLPAQRYRSGPFDVAIYDRNVVKLLYGKRSSIVVPIPADQLMIRLSATELSPCHSLQPCQIMVEATNAGQHVLASAGSKPLRLGIQGIDPHGNVIERDAGRANFSLPLYPGSTERVEVRLLPSADPRIVGYRLCLIQELVAWHCDRTEGSGGPALH